MNRRRRVDHEDLVPEPDFIGQMRVRQKNVDLVAVVDMGFAV